MMPPRDDAERMQRSWKYIGYPEFSKWMGSSNDFFVVRRFSAANARVLLYLQDQIAQTEEELADMDQACMEADDDTPFGRNDSLRLDRQLHPERDDLLEKLTSQLERYNRYLTTYSGIQDRGTAPVQHLRNVENWMSNHPFAIRKEEQHVLRNPADAIALVDGNQSTLRLLVERLFHHITWSMRARNRNGTHAGVSGTRYIHDRMLDRVVNTIIVCGALTLLFVPLWILEFQRSTVLRLAIVTTSIGFFNFLLAMGTRAKPFEMLASVAAYAAILMIFLSQRVTISD